MQKSMLAKLMMMTTSSHDAEALTALRKANKILADAKVSWADLLNVLEPDQSYRVPPSKRRPRPEPEWEIAVRDDKYTDEHEINALFENVFRHDLNDSFLSFLESLHLWWQTKGFLTEKQYKALKRAAREIDS